MKLLDCWLVWLQKRELLSWTTHRTQWSAVEGSVKTTWPPERPFWFLVPSSWVQLVENQRRTTTEWHMTAECRQKTSQCALDSTSRIKELRFNWSNPRNTPWYLCRRDLILCGFSGCNLVTPSQRQHLSVGSCFLFRAKKVKRNLKRVTFVVSRLFFLFFLEGTSAVVICWSRVCVWLVFVLKSLLQYQTVNI